MNGSLSTDKLIGLILAGGRSTRMGTDKRYLKIHDVPQMEFLFREITAAELPVFTACKQEDAVPAHFNPIFDAMDVPGPLAGIMAALHHHPDKAVLAVAVDMPGVNTATIIQLIRERKKEALATCFFNTDRGQPEPLFTIWEPACLPVLFRQTMNGNFSPLDFLKANPVKMITSTDPRVFDNLNKPEDLLRIEKNESENHFKRRLDGRNLDI